MKVVRDQNSQENPRPGEEKNVVFKRLRPQDLDTFRELVVLFKEVFEHAKEDIPDDNHLESVLNRPNFIAFSVSVNKQLAGGFTAYELRSYYKTQSEYFIYDIAVLPEFQRKGLASHFIKLFKAHAHVEGIGEFFVAANEEDEHALEFYRATGGIEEKVVHFSYPID